jgi:hypothetical protein
MYVRLQLMGVLSASKERGEGELPGCAGLNEVSLNFGDLWGGDVRRILRDGVHVDVGRDMAPLLGEALKQIGNLGVAVHTGRISALELLSTAEGTKVTGEVPYETLATIGAAGLRVSAPMVPVVQN